MSGSGQQQWQVQAEHSGSLIRLQNLIQRGSGSCLLILQQNRPRYRDGLIAFLGEAQADSRVLNLKELGGFEAFEAELEKGGQGRILHLINLESLGEKEQQAFFKGLNYHREHIARTCSGILAFWLPEPLVREMALQAADFWAWREQVLDFTVPVKPLERMAFDWFKNQNMEVQSKQERIKEIEKFLARAEKQPTLSAADLKHELGNIYKSIGEYAKAEQIFTEAIAEYRDMDEAKGCAHARHDLAQLLAEQGESEQALKIFREQVLPVNESLHDVRNKAVTMGKIADILEERGQLDEALNIREAEIPVYEKLGDVQAKAVTMGKIADILQTRGEFDNALDIRRNEELPVYERLGDVRSRAVTMGKIADILEERGQLDEALNIREAEIPVYEKLGDIRTKVLTVGKIADILYSQGRLDDSLRMFEEEVLPVLEQFGDVRAKAITIGKIADILISRSQLDEALSLLEDKVLPVLDKLNDIHEKAKIINRVAYIHRDRGQLDEARRILEEKELPVYETLGDVCGLLTGRVNLAILLQEMDAKANRARIEELLHLALADAQRLKLPGETEWIEEIMKEFRIKAQ